MIYLWFLTVFWWGRILNTGFNYSYFFLDFRPQISLFQMVRLELKPSIKRCESRSGLFESLILFRGKITRGLSTQKLYIHYVVLSPRWNQRYFVEIIYNIFHLFTSVFGKRYWDFEKLGDSIIMYIRPNPGFLYGLIFQTGCATLSKEWD